MRTDKMNMKQYHQGLADLCNRMNFSKHEENSQEWKEEYRECEEIRQQNVLAVKRWRNEPLEMEVFVEGVKKLATVFEGCPPEPKLAVYGKELNRLGMTNGDFPVAVDEIIKRRPEFPAICHFFICLYQRIAEVQDRNQIYPKL